MKIFLILSLLMSSFSLYAEDCVNCETPVGKNSLEEKIKSLESTVVINCTDQLKNDAEDEYNANFRHLPKKTAVIKGLKLSGSPDELTYLTKMLGEKPTDRWSKARSCDDVLCALTAVYDSRESAQRALNIAKRNGYIVSAGKDFIDEKDVPIGELFSLDEIQTIDLAYKQLPPTFKRLKTLDRLKRMPHGKLSPRSPNAAAYARPGYKSSYYSAEGEIVFIDSAFKDDKTWGALVAIHELAHHVDFSKSDKTQFGLSEIPAFMKISGWKKSVKYETDAKGKKVQVEDWSHTKDKKFVTSYAATEPAEDLADTAAYYVLEPQKLKSIDPEKYEYVKNNLFGGKEYLNEPDLQISTEELLAKCMEHYKEFPIYSKSFYSSSEVSNRCLDKFVADYKVTDPKICNYSKDQIKTYLFDKMAKTMEEVNSSLKSCSGKLESYRNECMAKDNDFRASCPVERCDVHELVKPKIRDASYIDRGSHAMEALKKKVGVTGIVTEVLNSVFAEKMGVSFEFSLYQHRDFIERANPTVAKMLVDNNFKFDQKDSTKNMAQSFLMSDKDLTKAFNAFQQNVLKAKEKSKEKNLELIKAWAQSQSLEDSPQFENLAETITQFNKGKGWFSR